jgi:hypothetical protein
MSGKTSFQQVLLPSAPSADVLGEPPSSRRPRSLRPPPRAFPATGHPGLVSGRPQGSVPASVVVQRNEGELITDYPKALEPVTAVRSTLITSSQTSLRERDLFDRYHALLVAPHRQKLLNLVAGEWLPLDIALAHYQACDGLGLATEEQVAIGKDVSRRVCETFLGLVVKAARGVGMTPWTLLSKANTMQSRLCVGGGVRVTKLGPKAARVELARMPHLMIPYVRQGVVGLYAGAVELLSSNVTARIVKTESAEPTRLLVLRIDWD